MRILLLVYLNMILASGCSPMDGARFEREEKYQMLESESETYEEYQADVEGILLNNWAELYASEVDHPGSSELEGKNEFTPEQLAVLHKPTNKPANCEFGDGRPGGMLLVHGLYDSPYVMKDLEQYFRDRCFQTRSILLPGNGTRPGNLLQIEYTAWIRAVDIAVQQLSKEMDDNIYLTGFSTGGALALNAALDNEEVKGVFLFAPALKLNSWHARILEGLMMDWVPFQKFEDKDLVKYESMTLNSVIEVSELASFVRRKLTGDRPDIAIPVLIVVARNDYTLDSNTAIRLFETGWFGDQSEMLIYAPLESGEYRTDVVSAGDSGAATRMPVYLNSSFIHNANGNEYLIADYSHMSLLLKPTDSHYGLEGEYKYCLQYFLDKSLKNSCETSGNTITDICFGERRVIGSAKYPQCNKRGLTVRRLTSNPRFEEMTQHLDRFIHQYIDGQNTAVGYLNCQLLAELRIRHR